MTLSTWFTAPPPRSTWRFKARTAIRREVESYTNVHADVNASELLRLVDEAYPFGPCSHTPYKAWLTERKLLIEALAAELPAPTADDRAACIVAIDLVEQDQADAAIKLLDEQAPRRLNRGCPACGVKPGERCVAGPQDRWTDEQINYRVVPHEARLQ